MRSEVGSLLQKRPREDSSAEEILAAGPARVLPSTPSESAWNCWAYLLYPTHFSFKVSSRRLYIFV